MDTPQVIVRKKMRILWFTNFPLPDVAAACGKEFLGSGHWMTTLARLIGQREEVELCIATAYPGIMNYSGNINGIEYRVVGQPRNRSLLKAYPDDLSACRRIVLDLMPDVVHVHGSERFFGLLRARNMIQTPTLLSMQGILNGIVPHLAGMMGPLQALRVGLGTDLIRRRSWLEQKMRYAEASTREAEIFQGVDAVMGRTEWDRAQALAMNPNIRYLHGDEALRADFWKSEWSVERCERHTVVFTNGGEPRRGLETLLRGAAILHSRYPKLQVILAGANVYAGSYGRLLRKLVRDLDLTACVQTAGYLKADAMAALLRRANVFVMPSLIENSPNSLCEAMLVGVPCVTAYSGGIPSLISNHESGLMYPPREHTMLAKQVADVFSSDDLAARLGKQASQTARKRHEPNTILDQVIGAYRALTNESPSIH